MKFVGCKKAKELSLTRDPAHPMATTLIKKNQDRDNPQSEIDDMDIEILKRVASMSEVTKAHFAGLDTEKATEFLKKAPAEQDAEAEAAKKAKDDAEAEAKKRADDEAAANANQTEATKHLSNEVAELKKTLEAERQEREIEKAALSADFDGYPGGAAEVTKQLKIAHAAGGAAKEAIIEAAKTLAKQAKMIGKSEFGAVSEQEILRAAPALAEVNKVAAERAKANGTSVGVEMVKMAEEPEWKSKVDEAQRQEQALVSA